MKKLYAIILLTCCIQHVIAQAGKLDTGFNGGGKLLDNIDGLTIANSLAIQQDGKIVVAGTYAKYNDLQDNPPGFTVVRYNSNGTRDNSFGYYGVATTSFANNATNLHVSVIIQSDGKIIAAGSSYDRRKILLARYNKNGSPDKTFGGGDGKVVTNYGSTESLEITSVVIQSNGKIVVGGSIYDLNREVGRDFFIARYNGNGTPDKTFGNNGSTTLVYSGDESAMSMAIQKDGKVIEAGYTDDGTDIDFAIARFDTSGLLDPGFGYLVTTGLGGKDYGQSVAVQPNGKIIVAGYSERKNSSVDVAMARYNTNGTLDNTFAGNGKLVKDFGNDEYIKSVAVQTNGKIIAGGFKIINGDAFFLARFNNNGSLDTSFRNGGKVITTFPRTPSSDGNGAQGYFIAIQQDGKIVFAGEEYDLYFDGNGYQIAVARYLGDKTNALIASDGEKKENTDVAAISSPKIFPDPVKDILNINGMNEAGSKIISIMNASGKLVKATSVSERSYSWNIADLPAGVYYIVIDDSKKKSKTKFIKD